MEENEFKDFSVDVKRDILDIINDSPSLIKLGERQYQVKNMRYYALYRICRLVMDMRKADEDLSDDNKIIYALCTDLSAMAEILALVLCNHMFTPEQSDEERDAIVATMKRKIYGSEFDINEWAAIVLAAIKSIDLSSFFLLKKSVSTLTDSLLTRKTKSVETASQFTEALSLLTPQISSESSHNTR